MLFVKPLLFFKARPLFLAPSVLPILLLSIAKWKFPFWLSLCWALCHWLRSRWNMGPNFKPGQARGSIRKVARRKVAQTKKGDRESVEEKSISFDAGLPTFWPLLAFKSIVSVWYVSIVNPSSFQLKRQGKYWRECTNFTIAFARICNFLPFLMPIWPSEGMWG